MLRVRFLTIIVATITVATASKPTQAQCMYEVMVVEGRLCSDNEPVGLEFTAINGLGQTAGVRGGCGVFSPVFPIRWAQETGVLDLDSPPGPDTSVEIEGINDNGWVVGNYFSSDGREAVLWKGTEAIELPNSIENAVWAEAEAINQQGVIVGWGGMPEPDRAVIWVDQQMVDIGSSFPSSYSYGKDINDHGVVVGLTASPGEFLAFVWQDGEYWSLPAPTGSERTEALRINNRGLIAGRARFPLPDEPVAWEWRFCVWRGGEPELLLTDDGTRVGVTGLNDAGQIVGSLLVPGPDPAVIWQDGVVSEIDSLVVGPPLTNLRVFSINNEGQIAGTTAGAAVILTPIDSGPADLNLDCRVDEYDLMILLSDWGPSLLSSDIDQDGVVGPADLATLLANWSR